MTQEITRQAWIELPSDEVVRAMMPADRRHPYDFGFVAGMTRLVRAHPRIGPALGALFNHVMFVPGLLDRLGYEDPALDGVEHRDLVRHLLVQLPEREQRILLLRYYSNLTQSQISAELGVSQMHVSRLLARSFQRLRSANRIDA